MKLPTRLWLIFTLVSLTCSVLVYFAMAYFVPHVRTISVQADAVAVANTYIVLTTLIVTAFAALVALVSFYLAQNTNEMKTRKLEDDFQKHIENSDDFSKKLHELANRRISEVIETFEKSDKFELLVEKLLTKAEQRAKEAAEGKSAVAAVFAASRKT